MIVASAGPVLVLSAALLACRRANVALAVVVVQAAVLAISALSQRHYLAAALLALFNAAGAGVLLFGRDTVSLLKPRVALPTRLAAAAVLAVLATPVSVPLAVVLLGILATAASRDGTIQVLGLLTMQNGIALAGLGLGTPEQIAAILPVIPGLALAARWRGA
jgi:hydrogenase-4 membrane subunit HyfE